MAAVPDQYTHRISFKVKDGGQFIVADVKFDAVSGVPDVDIINSSKPLNLALVDSFKEFAELVGKTLVKFEGLKSVSVRERGYTDPDAKRKNP